MARSAAPDFCPSFPLQARLKVRSFSPLPLPVSRPLLLPPPSLRPCRPFTIPFSFLLYRPWSPLYARLSLLYLRSPSLPRFQRSLFLRSIPSATPLRSSFSLPFPLYFTSSFSHFLISPSHCLVPFPTVPGLPSYLYPSPSPPSARCAPIPFFRHPSSSDASTSSLDFPPTLC